MVQHDISNYNASMYLLRCTLYWYILLTIRKLHATITDET